MCISCLLTSNIMGKLAKLAKLAKPQKSKKHKKLKFVDPFYHGERKERMDAGKNLEPKYLEQGLSRSLKDLMRRSQQAKEMENKSRRQQKEIVKKRRLAQLSTEGAEREFEEVHFKQKKGEKHSTFMERVETTTQMAIKESQIEASQKLKYDPVMGDTEPDKQSKKKQRMKVKKLLKKEKQKQKREDRRDDFDQFKDEVQFGEVVHGLPSLTVRPKKSSAHSKPAVDSLLLYNKMKQSGSNLLKPSSGHSINRKDKGNSRLK